MCREIDTYNREAATRAEQLRKLPDNQPAKREVDEVLYWDELYRAALQKRKYLEEHEALPEETPAKGFRGKIVIPVSGLELADTIRNLAKNVSVWKKRLGQERYPEAREKYAMYLELLKEARNNATAARAKQIKDSNADIE